MKERRWLWKKLVFAFWFVCLLGQVWKASAQFPRPASKEDPKRTFLNDVVFRDRQLQVLVSKAEQALQEGRTVEGLQLLQRVLDSPEDSFAWTGSPPRLTSIRAHALRVLSSAGRQVWKAYERLFGVKARQLWKGRGREDRALNVAYQVVRRYEFTQAGFEVLSWLLAKWLDEGRFELAAHCADRLLAEPAHHQKMTAEIALRVLAAYTATGKDEKAQQLLLEYGDEWVEWQGRLELFRKAAAQMSLPSSVCRPKWACTGGDVHRNRWTPGSQPLLRPLWTSRFQLDQLNGKEVVKEWVQSGREDPSQPFALACSPVVAEGCLFVRDFSGIRAIELQSGRLLWHYKSELGWLELVQRINQTYGASSSVTNSAFAGNSTVGTLTSDSRRVYAIEFAAPAPGSLPPVSASTNNLPSGLRFPSRRVDEQYTRWLSWNYLIALPASPSHSLKKAVRPVWRLGGRPHSNAPLAGYYFLTPPVPLGEKLYVMAEAQQQLKLLALEAETGKILWEQTVALTDKTINHPSQQQRRVSSCFPACSAGLVVCPTDLGVLVAVNALTGELKWLQLYRETNTRLKRRFPWLVTRDLPPFKGRLSIPPLPHIHAGRVVFLPHDAESLFCYELESGKLDWKIPRGEAVYVGVVTDETVLVVGTSKVFGYSLQDGSLRWSTPVGACAGRGVAVGKYYLIPLKNGHVAAVNLRTGRGSDLEIDLQTLQRLPWVNELGLKLYQPQATVSKPSASNFTNTATAAASTASASQLLPPATHTPPAPPSPSTTARPTPAPASNTTTAAEANVGVAASTVPAASPRKKSDSKKENQKKQPQPAADSPASALAETTSPTTVSAEAYTNRSFLPLGNLVAVDGLVVSIGPYGVTAFIQTEQLKQLLLAAQQTDSSLPASLLRAAVELTQGNLEEAERLLEPVERFEQNNTLKQAAQRLKVDILYVKLQTGLENPHELLKQLKQLAVTPQQQRRYLLQRILVGQKAGQYADVLESVQELALLGTDGWLPQQQNFRYRVTLRRWLAEVTRDAWEHLPKPQQLEYKQRLLDDFHKAAEARDLFKLKKWVELYDRWPEADQGRLLLADLLQRQGELQQAELWLLQARGSSDRRTVARATRRLVELYSRIGFNIEAARLLRELADRFADVPLENGQTGLEYVQRFPREQPSWNAYVRLLPVPWSVEHVEIQVHRTELNELQEGKLFVQNNYRRWYRTKFGFPFYLREALTSNREFVRLNIIDSETGELWTEKRLPSQNTLQYWSVLSNVGHLIIVGAPKAIYGFSLFERDFAGPYWKSPFTLLQYQPEILRVGVCTPKVCVCQTSKLLVAVDPVDGHLLWQRSETMAAQGMFFDQRNGLFGDEQVLVVLARQSRSSAGASYKVFRTQTGELLREGELDLDQSSLRRVFGRKLFYVSKAVQGHRWLKIWDPLTNKVEWKTPFNGRLLVTVTPDGQLVVVTKDGHLQARDVTAGRTVVDLELDRDLFSRLGYIRAFHDQQHYYFNFGSLNRNNNRKYLFSMDEVAPMVNIQGLLLAVDMKTSRILWQRNFPARSFLLLNDFNLPFLVARCRLRIPPHRLAQTMAIELIDTNTGQTLGYNEHLPVEPIVHAFYWPQEGKLTLNGQKNSIDILFGRSRQHPLLFDQPL